MPPLTSGQRELLTFVSKHDGVRRGEINDYFAALCLFYAKDGWKWGMIGLRERGLVEHVGFWWIATDLAMAVLLDS